MKKPLMIAQAPARGGDPFRPMTGMFMRKILKLTGWTEFQYRTGFEFINLVHEFPGGGVIGKGHLFPMAEARWKASLLRWSGELNDRVIVVWGRQTAKALNLHIVGDHFCEANYHFDLRSDYYVFPHPSGIVQWWNSEHNRQLAATTLKEISC